MMGAGHRSDRRRCSIRCCVPEIVERGGELRATGHRWGESNNAADPDPGDGHLKSRENLTKTHRTQPFCTPP